MANRKTAQVFTTPQFDPVAASTHLFVGDLVMLDTSGNAVAGSVTTGLVARGVCRFEVDNSLGIAGAKGVETLQGVFLLKMKSGDEPTQAELGDVVYATGPQEVGKTSTGRSVAGVLMGLIDSQAAVAVGQWPLQVGLLAANNLSDVSSASSARSNLGANSGAFEGAKISSKAADAEVFRFVATKAGTITLFKTVLNAALATADATATLKVNATAVTGGVVTMTQAASAAGQVNTTTPSALNTFVAGDVVSITVGGGSTATATFNARVEFTY